MTWNVSPSRGTRKNKRIRGTGTWGSEGRRLNQHKQRQLRRQRGFGSWGAQQRRLERAERQRSTKMRGYFTTVVAVVLIFSALLLFSAGTRATGMMILFVAAVLYVITRRKRA